MDCCPGQPLPAQALGAPCLWGSRQQVGQSPGAGRVSGADHIGAPATPCHALWVRAAQETAVLGCMTECVLGLEARGKGCELEPAHTGGKAVAVLLGRVTGADVRLFIHTPVGRACWGARTREWACTGGGVLLSEGGCLRARCLSVCWGWDACTRTNPYVLRRLCAGVPSCWGACVRRCLYAGVHAWGSVCVLGCLRAEAPACALGCLPACRGTCVLGCLRAGVPAHTLLTTATLTSPFALASTEQKQLRAFHAVRVPPPRHHSACSPLVRSTLPRC